MKELTPLSPNQSVATITETKSTAVGFLVLNSSA